MQAELHLREYSYFPYEERLAAREVQVLLGCNAFRRDGVLGAEFPKYKKRVLPRLTYFSKAVLESGEEIVPDQAKWEASANGKHDSGGRAAPRGQSTRYSLHWLHEYKGRFNPQIVRAIGNILALEEGAWVLDPFCGCGTVLLEAAHIGWNAAGIDLNPLAILLSNTKVGLLRMDVSRFRDLVTPLISDVGNLLALSTDWDEDLGPRARSALSRASNGEQVKGGAYIERWFPQERLVAVACGPQPDQHGP